MDPRLWEMMGTVPGTLYIRGAHLQHGGSTLLLECKVVNEHFPAGRYWRIHFKQCRDIRFQVIDPTITDDNVEALGMFLGEQGHGRPAVVYTGATEIVVSYKEVDIYESSR